MALLTLSAALAMAATCSGLPPYLVPLAVGLALNEGHGTFNTEATNHNANGSIDYGATQINTVNLGWLHETPVTVMQPCNNLIDGVKVFFAKYNGNPPDAVKAAYAASAVAQVNRAAATTPEPPAPEADDPDDPKPPTWDMEAVAEWRNRHDPTAKKAAEQDLPDTAVAQVIRKELR